MIRALFRDTISKNELSGTAIQMAAEQGTLSLLPKSPLRTLAHSGPAVASAVATVVSKISGISRARLFRTDRHQFPLTLDSFMHSRRPVLARPAEF